MGVEKRRYPRVEITWPVTVITPNGPKGGRIQNIGLGGALIQRTKVPELDGFFAWSLRLLNLTSSLPLPRWSGPILFSTTSPGFMKWV
jgi:hypothetical protein